jgi:excisionase family DNA binding protein
MLTAEEPATITATEEERRVYRELAARLAALPPDHLRLAAPDGGLIALPPALAGLLREAAALLAAAGGLVLMPAGRDLTTTEAANLLGVSRQYLTRLLDRGALPSHRVGTHRRIASADLLAYRRDRRERARAGLDELVRASEDLGLYDQPAG